MGENATAPAPHLERRLGTFQATALNMANMVGVGPFLTIPLIVEKLPGRHVMLGWALGLVVVLADSMIWCELGAALPGSGGTYHFLKEVFRPFRFGRLVPFLFIWQFIFSGPLEAASGCIGFVNYLSRIWPESWGALDASGALTFQGKMVGSSLAALAVVLLYRKIGSIGKLTVCLWVGMLATVVVAIAAAASRFDPARAFAPVPGGFHLDAKFAVALGAALNIALYDFLGYYDICYLGDEVRDPVRTIPRAVVTSVLAVAAIYSVMNIGILGALPRTEIDSFKSAVFTHLVQSAWGNWPANLFTVLILWTAFASVFALLLGYSRIPFAAARDGYFFRAFADLHPTRDFPRLSLLILGAVTMVACWLPFDRVLTALLASRILVQFVVQILAVVLVRRARPDIHLPFRMWLYPLPCLVALAGWLYAFGSSGGDSIAFSLGSLILGILTFALIFRVRRAGVGP